MQAEEVAHFSHTRLLEIVIITRSPSNLRPTTCKYVYLVRRGQFRSCNKDGGHTIKSAISENLMLHSMHHAYFMALCFIEPELSLQEVLHCGNRDFLPFC